MKKVLFIIATVFTIGFFTGCDDGDESIPETEVTGNYLIHNGETFPLTKAFVATFTDTVKKKFILQLGGEEMIFGGDDLAGDGEGVTVFADGDFTIGTFTIKDDSWALSNWVSNPNGPGSGNSSSLEGGSIKVISATNPIEVEISGTNTEAYYKGEATIVSWN